MKYAFNLSNTHGRSAGNTHGGQFGGLGRLTCIIKPRQRRVAWQLHRCQDANVDQQAVRSSQKGQNSAAKIKKKKKQHKAGLAHGKTVSSFF